MSTIVRLKQGSPEWHEHRTKYCNASEAPAVMGVSPWQTPFELWCLRTGRAESKTTPAMAHGSAMEGAAREAYEHQTGLVMEPLVLVEGCYSASLDGITLEGDLILEIKCPYRGRDSELWKAVAGGTVPEHYGWQIEQQLMVSGASRAHLWVFAGGDGLMVEAVPQPERWDALRGAWEAFMRCVSSDTPPPLTERDTRTREDAAWRAAAQAYIEAKRTADEAGARLEEAKAALVGLASHPSESGCGATVTRFWKRGAVDYKKVPELKGVDLEQYRKESRLEVRVSGA